MFEYTGRMVVLAVTLSTTIFLSGCSRSISVVKDSDAPNGGFKIGQVLDHKGNCSSSSWSSSKDANDRPVVEFKCEVRISDGTLNQIRSQLHADVARQFDDRQKGGVHLAHEDGTPSQDSLSAYRHEESLADEEHRLSDDPEALQQLAQLKADYAKIADDLSNADAQCVASLPKRHEAQDASVNKFVDDHAKVSEVIKFVLKDDQIVERVLSAHFQDESDALPEGTAGLLYQGMLSPNNPGVEEATLTSRLGRRMDVGDIYFCGNPEPYKLYDRVNAFSKSLLQVDTDYRDRRNAQPQPQG